MTTRGRGKLPGYGLREQLHGREVRRSRDPMSAAGRQRGEPDLVNLAQVRVLHFEHDHDFLRVERVPRHAGERDFHLHELAVGGDTPTANGERAVRELHDGIKHVDGIGSHDPAQPRKASQIEIVALVPERQGDR